VTGSFWLDLLLGMAAAVILGWLTLVIGLVIARPQRGLLREALRLLPDVLRLVRRLAADKTLPRGVRLRLGLLLAYLACPIDLIPDFIPVLGYADDAIIVTAVLRSVVRRTGIDAVRAHWPGTDDGFACDRPAHRPRPRHTMTHPYSRVLVPSVAVSRPACLALQDRVKWLGRRCVATAAESREGCGCATPRLLSG
jgi:uncharacterized membrane protein YkvA (DUF1232 family)